MKPIKSDTELEKIHSTGKGLIYNDFASKGPSGKDYNVLHAASCHWVARSNVNISKIFFSNIDEAVKWLRKYRGEEGKNWKRCNTCQAKARPHSGVFREFKVTSTVVMAGPFTETDAENILLQYLKERDYRVRRQVRVASGIVDIVAKGPDGCWLIEVKGEDKGGYTSAEMNFQIGIGQVVSRMTDSRVRYALAFPITRDFKKVLRKYKGSLGFERLNINFFVIHRDGGVEKYDATNIQKLIESV